MIRCAVPLVAILINVSMDDADAPPALIGIDQCSVGQTTLLIGLLDIEQFDANAWDIQDMRDPIQYECMWNQLSFRIATTTPLANQPVRDVKAHGTASYALDVAGTEYIWNIEGFYAAHADTNSLTIQSVPVFGISRDCLGPFNGTDWPVFLAKEGLVHAIRAGVNISHTESADAWTTRFSRDNRESVTMEIICSKAHRAISEIRISMKRAAPTSGDSTTTLENNEVGLFRYYVCEWRDVDGRWLPWKAIRELTLYSGDAMGLSRQKPMVQRIGLIRQTFSSGLPDTDHDYFSATATIGTRVADARQNTSYIIGQNYILADETMFVTPTPIQHVLAPEDTEALLRSATPQ